MSDLETKARAVITAWGDWCDADGWDNPEFDGFCKALEELRDLLGMHVLHDEAS